MGLVQIQNIGIEMAITAVINIIYSIKGIMKFWNISIALWNMKETFVTHIVHVLYLSSLIGSILS